MNFHYFNLLLQYYYSKCLGPKRPRLTWAMKRTLDAIDDGIENQNLLC